MNWPYNLHAHTPYGDGHSPARAYVDAAVANGMRTIGISEHAPLGPDVTWTLALDALPAYERELSGLAEEYADEIELLRGLEVDWWPAHGEWFERIGPSRWDYLIGSVHFVTVDAGTLGVDDSPPIFEKGIRDVFGGDIRAACDAFFECERQAASSGRFQILGHFDLIKKFNRNARYFDTAESWYREMAYTVVDAAAASGIIVEVNTAGLDKAAQECYPAPWLIARCVERGVRLTLNSDAHRSAEIQRHFGTVLPELDRLGVRELWRLSGGEWTGVRLAGLRL